MWRMSGLPCNTRKVLGEFLAQISFAGKNIPRRSIFELCVKRNWETDRISCCDSYVICVVPALLATKKEHVIAGN